MKTRVSALLIVAALSTACIPKLAPLSGVEAPASKLPRTTVAPGHRLIVFNWDLSDQDVSAKGDGAARIASPDSARLDFNLGGPFGGGGFAVLIGDSVSAPGPDMIRKLIPPPTLLWASLGRVALPNLPDTVIRVDGQTLRADIGSPVAWRLTFRADTLVRAERVDGGRVAEWMERSDSTHIRYRNESSRRSLQLTLTRTQEVFGFDSSIWRIDR